MKQSEKSIRVLSDGLMFEENRISDSKDKFPVISYDLDQLCHHYHTKEFLTLKYEEVLATASYLLKILDMADSINDCLYKIQKNRDKTDETGVPYEDPKVQVSKALSYTQKLLSLIEDIKINIKDLIASEYCVGLKKDFDQFIISLHMLQTGTPVPPKLEDMIKALLPGVQVLHLYMGNLNADQHVVEVSGFLQYEKEMERILFSFRDMLMNQFSYYVTSQDYLNNPERRCVFVLENSRYHGFTFDKTGLDDSGENSRILLGLCSLKKTRDFYKVMNSYLQEAMNISRKGIEDARMRTDLSQVEVLINEYEKIYKSKTGFSINKVKKAILNPRVHEALNSLVIHRRSELCEQVLKTKGNPWNEKLPYSRNYEIETVYFLSLIQQRYDPDSRFPSAAYQKFLNLFSSSLVPDQRMYEHHKSFCDNNRVIYTPAFKKDFMQLVYA